MKNLAPYQILFPLGIFSALLAVAIWFIQDLHWFTTPVMLVHGKLVVGGFLWSFIMGFLMTAVPKMSGTASANTFEKLFALTLIILQIFNSWNIDGRFFYGTQIVLVLFLAVFALRRLIAAKKSVPVFFSHIGLALVLAIAGSAYYYTGRTLMGLHLFHVGTILMLVLGIGTRFFSFLSGLPSVFETSSTPATRTLFHVMALGIAGLLFMAGGGHYWAYLALTVLLSFYLTIIWKIHRKSDRPSALKFAVRIVAASIPASFFLCWLYPMHVVTYLHILFIGCFTLITLGVATRVTLAHGSYSTDREMSSKALWVLVICIVLAFLSRIFYGYTLGDWKKSFLHLAGTFWFIGLSAWCYAFFFKMFKPGELKKPSC